MADRESQLIRQELLHTFEDGSERVIRIRVAYHTRWGSAGRGYVLHVEPVTVKAPEPSGIRFVTYALLSGQSRMIETAARFSARRLEQIASTLRDLNITEASPPGPVREWALALAAMRLQVLAGETLKGAVVTTQEAH
jgi:hypothetical protein